MLRAAPEAAFAYYVLQLHCGTPLWLILLLLTREQKLGCRQHALLTAKSVGLYPTSWFIV